MIRDPGFEWTVVQGLSGHFNYGAQLTQNTKDWTFTDSPTNPKTCFAGIAFDDNSNYTTGNPPAPDGLQVGFVQGDSSISQTITLAQGTYTLSLVAAQSALNQSPQSLNVFVDGILEGNIQPSGTPYQESLIEFTVKAGARTITFQGTRMTANTVLIDEVVCTPGSSLTVPPRQRHPAKVEFLAQPNSSASGSILAAVRIAVRDRSGDLWSGLTVRLTLIRLEARGHVVISRMFHAKTMSGVATFSRLAIRVPGRYVLRAEVGRQHVNSEVFDIGSGQAYQLTGTNRRSLADRSLRLH
jgi:hypothetical protein